MAVKKVNSLLLVLERKRNFVFLFTSIVRYEENAMDLYSNFAQKCASQVSYKMPVYLCESTASPLLLFFLNSIFQEKKEYKGSISYF